MSLRTYSINLSQDELKKQAGELRQSQWLGLADSGIDFIPSNDFSFYDGMLDMAVLVNAIPDGYRSLALDEIDTAFAMARGYQGRKGDVKALPMKKWFNTNYHYIVPELEAGLDILLNGMKPFAEYREAQACDIDTRPVVIGPYTFMKLSQNKSQLSFTRLLE